MRLTIRRVKLDRQGYDSQGRYWGAGERLYFCPEVDAVREQTAAWFTESPHCRASDAKAAREIFKARIDMMDRPARKRSFWTGEVTP